MPRYPALTIKELKAIQEANKGNPEVRRLLWEIRRLHEVLFRFDTHLRHLNCNASYLVENAQASCVVLLDSEPAVRWRNAVEERKRRRDRGFLDHYRPRFDKPTEPGSP